MYHGTFGLAPDNPISGARNTWDKAEQVRGGPGLARLPSWRKPLILTVVIEIGGIFLYRFVGNIS